MYAKLILTFLACPLFAPVPRQPVDPWDGHHFERARYPMYVKKVGPDEYRIYVGTLPNMPGWPTRRVMSGEEVGQFVNEGREPDPKPEPQPEPDAPPDIVLRLAPAPRFAFPKK